MNEKTAVAVREKEAVEGYEQETQLSIEEAGRAIDKVRAFIKAKLKSGYDYAKIPGTARPTLLQPGAEKVCMYLRVRPEYETKRTELPDGHLEVEAICRLYSLRSGLIVGAGAGSCSTLESRHRYRYIKAKDKPTQEEADYLKSIGKGKWIGSREKGWAWYERTDNQNPHDQRHTVLLIGCKRSMVKAVRTMAALSEVFSQDVEDFPEVHDVERLDADELPQGRIEKGEPEEAKKPAEAEKPKATAKEKVVVSFSADKKKGFVVGDNTLMAACLGLRWNQQFGAKLINNRWEMAAAWVPAFMELAAKKGLPVIEEAATAQPPPSAAEVGFTAELKPQITPEITDEDVPF